MPFWGKQPQKSKRAELVNQVAEGLLRPENTNPLEGFNLRLAQNQTRDRAVAEWHAAMTAAMVCGMWSSLKTQEKVKPILDAFHPKFLNILEPSCRDEFLEIANVREPE